MKKNILIIFLLIALSSCLSRVEKRGYAFDLSDFQLLQEGVTTKERAIKIMGSPTMVSDFDDSETWIYFAEDLKFLLFFQPEIISRNVMVLRFDEENNLKELRNIDLATEVKNLNFASNYTAVESHNVSLLKSFFSNVGAIKPQ